MRHSEKRRCSPTDFYSVGAERGRPRTEIRRAWSLCLVREGIACAKVVPRSRVLLPSDMDVGVRYCSRREVVLLYLFVLVVATAFFLVLLSLSSLGGMSPGRVSVAFALVLVACLVAAWGGRRVARG